MCAAVTAELVVDPDMAGNPKKELESLGRWPSAGTDVNVPLVTPSPVLLLVRPCLERSADVGGSWGSA